MKTGIRLKQLEARDENRWSGHRRKSPWSNRMRIVIADDHNLMRAGFKNLLTALDHTIVAEAENFADLEEDD